MKKEKKNEKKDTIQININKGNLIKGISVVLVVLAVIGLSYFASSSYGTNSKSVEFIDINIDDYLEKLNGEEKSIIYVASPTCSYCSMETPILKKIASKYDLEVFYLDTSNFYDASIQDYTEDGYKFINSAEVYEQGYGTPNTIIVQNGEIIDGVYQYVEASELDDLFKRNGYVNE